MAPESSYGVPIGWIQLDIRTFWKEVCYQYMRHTISFNRAVHHPINPDLLLIFWIINKKRLTKNTINLFDFKYYVTYHLCCWCVLHNLPLFFFFHSDIYSYKITNFISCKAASNHNRTTTRIYSWDNTLIYHSLVRKSKNKLSSFFLKYFEFAFVTEKHLRPKFHWPIPVLTSQL